MVLNPEQQLYLPDQQDESIPSVLSIYLYNATNLPSILLVVDSRLGTKSPKLISFTSFTEVRTIGHDW